METTKESQRFSSSKFNRHVHELNMSKSLRLASEFMEDLKADLRLDYFTIKMGPYLLDMEDLWSPRDPIQLRHRMIELDSIRNHKSHTKRVSKIPFIDPRVEHHFFNKATVFYWTQSAIDSMIRCDGPLILGAIWNTWCSILGRTPHYLLDDFFAIPVNVKKELAWTIPGVCRVHEQLCAQIRTSQEETAKTGRPPRPDPRFFKIHPIFEALIIVFDEFNNVLPERQEDGKRHFDDFAQHQNIILVRTGHEDRLREPISFESLKQEALPLARREDMRNKDAIRVPLQVGVRFVAELFQREPLFSIELESDIFQTTENPDHPCREFEKEAQAYLEERLEKCQTWDFASLQALRNRVPHYMSENLLETESRFEIRPFGLGWV